MIKALIMAGGIGARFWPKSRLTTPKHLLNIINDKTMLENTVCRLDNILKREDIFIITNVEQTDSVKEKVEGLSEQNIIAEPMGKNTSAAIGYGAVLMSEIDPDAIMVVLPADHYIADIKRFNNKILKAAEIASKDDVLVTIGIKPAHPATGYGYIQVGKSEENDVYEVDNFAEKPNFETAVRFLDNGGFYWNSGIFIWKASVILNQIKLHLPELFESLQKIKSAVKENRLETVIQRIYREIKSESIDYGVMEKAEKVKMVVGDFGWSDVGSWSEVYGLKKDNSSENVVEGEFFGLDTKECLILNEEHGKMITTIGLEKMAVINTDDALLITPLDKSQDVKTVVEYLKAKNKDHLLR